MNKDFIILEAKALGFDLVGFAKPEINPIYQKWFEEYIELGLHGEMEWMDSKTRTHPKLIWDKVQSIIVLGMNYAPDYNPLAMLEKKNIGLISAYAKNRDYHDVMKGKLKLLASKLHSRYKSSFKVFVDTAPIMEKPIAEIAGIGWQGKHSCILSREYGNWLFLGSIFTDVEIGADEPHQNLCGSCRKCLDICPTQAFIAPFKLDARRCISYLTIEYKGHIPREFRKAIGNRIYGCDDCLAICPWNKFAKESSHIAYKSRKELENPLLSELVKLDDGNFRKLFSASPVKRIGRNRFIRNVLIAIGNSGDISYIPDIVRLLGDEAAIIRAMAIWAFGELAKKEEIVAISKIYLEQEYDPEVQDEWVMVLPISTIFIRE